MLGWGIGLGALGLLGLFFAALHLANATVLTTVQILLAVFFLVRGDAISLRSQMRSLASQLHLSFSRYSLFTRIVLALTALFSFLLTLAPPFEAFDVLINHLALPASLLQNWWFAAAEYSSVLVSYTHRECLPLGACHGQ